MVMIGRYVSGVRNIFLRVGLVGLFVVEGYALRHVYVAAVMLTVLVGLVGLQCYRGAFVLDAGYS